MEVPTTNIILKWISNEGGDHLFDTNLKEVSLITKDAFEPSLPLSVVLHIGYKKAPYVIQRFGDIKMLVDQTLDPMVSAYFKNIGQSKTLIELLQERRTCLHNYCLRLKYYIVVPDCFFKSAIPKVLSNKRSSRGVEYLRRLLLQGIPTNLQMKNVVFSYSIKVIMKP